MFASHAQLMSSAIFFSYQQTFNKSRQLNITFQMWELKQVHSKQLGGSTSLDWPLQPAATVG